MKKQILCTALLLSISGGAMAQDAGYNWQQPQQQPQSYGAAVQQQAQQVQVPQQDPVMEQVGYLQQEWAKIKYQMPDEDAQLDAIHRLEEHAEKVTYNYPSRAEPKIWEGIILSTDAGIVKGISALGKVKKAKTLFEEALHTNPNALEGSAYTSLGSLYYQVPGWPIAFGDNDKAEENLKMALQLNPNGIDPNFFYGDFLMQDDKYSQAQQYFERALQAPDRPDRVLADAGRRQEIKAKLAQIAQKTSETRSTRF